MASNKKSNNKESASPTYPSKANGPRYIKEVIEEWTEKLDNLYHQDGLVIPGIETGYEDFDKITLGLHPGELTIIAGRPAMGKTTFALNIAERVSLKQNKAVLVFSLEMSLHAVITRLVSSMGYVEQRRLRTGGLTEDDWPRVSASIAILHERSQLYIDDTARMTASEIGERISLLQKERGEIGLVIIDYIQLMQVPSTNENRTADISEVSRSLKLLAKEFNIPIIAVSQLNRGLESRTDKRPILSDLRDSGAIEEDADVIAFIYRDEVYNRNSSERGLAHIIVAKQRNGPIGTVRLLFQGELSRFDNLSPEFIEFS